MTAVRDADDQSKALLPNASRSVTAVASWSAS
jgi:hypothetical protein